MTEKVVVWGTGTVGCKALRVILAHPELELAGVIVHDPAKAGRDAADLCAPLTSDGPGDPPPTGVVATLDPAEALAAGPDIVCYTAVGTGSSEVARVAGALVDVCDLLARGVDVVSTPITSMVYPPMADPVLRSRLEQACEAGQASCFVSGRHPGFATDLLPLTLTGLTVGVESLRVAELISYERWHKFTKPRSTDRFLGAADGGVCGREGSQSGPQVVLGRLEPAVRGRGVVGAGCSAAVRRAAGAV